MKNKFNADNEIKRILFPPIRYVVVNELPKIAEINTIYWMDGDSYMYDTKNGWTMICTTNKPIKEEKPTRILKLICTSCGSTNIEEHNGHYQCAYCGTKYK